MTDYSERVKALQLCNGPGLLTCRECQYNNDMLSCVYRMRRDAAAAIEELQDKVFELEEELSDADIAANDNARQIEELQAEVKILKVSGREAYFEGLTAGVEPKRGEWIEENRRPRSSQFVCSECHRTAYDPQPTRDKAWRKRCRYAYCPNCGAKMEVQE